MLKVSHCCDRFVLLISPAAELRFISDPPTLNIYGIHRMNKSDNLELTCRYVRLCIHLTDASVGETGFTNFLLHTKRFAKQQNYPRTYSCPHHMQQTCACHCLCSKGACAVCVLKNSLYKQHEHLTGVIVFYRKIKSINE